MVTGGKVLKLEVELKRFRGGHCTSPAQPTPLSALLDRPGLQLLYCLIRAGRLRWEKGGLWGRLHEHPPRSTSHTLANITQPESLATIENISSHTFDIIL